MFRRMFHKRLQSLRKELLRVLHGSFTLREAQRFAEGTGISVPLDLSKKLLLQRAEGSKAGVK